MNTLSEHFITRIEQTQNYTEVEVDEDYASDYKGFFVPKTSRFCNPFIFQPVKILRYVYIQHDNFGKNQKEVN